MTADGQPTQLTLKSGGVFRVDFYSQNEIERIANHTVSQLELLDKVEADAIAEIDSQLRALEQEIATSAGQLLSLEMRHAEIREEIATLPEVKEKLKAFAGSGGEDAGIVEKAHTQKALRDWERRAIDSIDNVLSEYQERLRSQSQWLATETGLQLTEDMLAGANGMVLSEFAKQLAACGEDIDNLLRQMEDRLSQTREQLEKTNVILAVAHNQQEMAFRTLIEKHDILMEQATERARLERLRNDLLAKTRNLEETDLRLGELRRQRASLLERLSELRDKRFAIRQSVADQINAKVSPMIRVCLEQFGDVSEYHRILGGR